MNTPVNHVSWETLNDYADDALSTSARSDVARHLDGCPECRRTAQQLRDTIAAAGASSPSIEPPGAAWAAIRAEIERKKIVALPHVPVPASLASRFRLATAAVLLILASSATTAWLMSRNSGPEFAVNTPDTSIAPIAAALPASLVSMERGYLQTVSELTATLNASRTKLAPETVRAVERSLKVIDDAIAEARAALLNDPASDLLRDMLSKNYQQKVDLLRRASARAETT